MKKVEGGVTAAKGFQAAGCAAGIKKEGIMDMAMIYSETPCHTAGTFTTNVVKAAPVKWDQDIVHHHDGAQVVVCNSGIANACTGEEGMGYCRATAEEAARMLHVPETAVLVASTGVIGKQLPMDRIKGGIAKLALMLEDTREAAALAARAIMTTDTHPKETAVSLELGGKTVTIGSMCKGSGMIHPNMCTMLSFVTTDVKISGELLQEALSEVVQDTYNMVSVDGDTSTNDTVLLLANGMAEIRRSPRRMKNMKRSRRRFLRVNKIQAMNIAGDGEGATALFEVKVVGAGEQGAGGDAEQIDHHLQLTKAAIFGHDANWGRILCAMGYSGASFDPEKVDLYFESEAGKLQIIKDGVATDYSEEEATRILSEKKVTAVADIHMGEAQATAWGCDLTYDYVKINADYRS